MHYYKHNIGDYRRRTAHLTIIEHGMYRQLLDQYYLDEKPFSLDMTKLMRLLCVRTADEERSLCVILEEFFVKTEDGFIHKHADEQILEFRKKSNKASDAASIRWEKQKKNHNVKQSSERNANAMRTYNERNANHKPLTTNQEPLTNSSIGDKAPQRFDEFWDVFADKRGKAAALKVWKRKKLDNRADEVIVGARRYVATRGTERRYWKQAQGWLGDERWSDDPLDRGKENETNTRDDRSRARRHSDKLDEIARRSLEREAAAGRALDGSNIQALPGAILGEMDLSDGGD